MSSFPWWGYVILAGLSWGTYVPIIFYGGSELTTKPGTIGGRLASILCVGVAYFLLAVVVPLVVMNIRDDAKPEWKMNGLIFSGLAGVMGAVGAICVIFASKAAMDTAKGEYETQEAAIVEKLDQATEPPAKAEAEQALKDFRAEKPRFLASYRIYIAPLIFCLAPMINTLLSLVWHPKAGDPWHFANPIEALSAKLVLGIVLIAAGVFLVLLSKEQAEVSKPAPVPAPTAK